MNARTKIFLLLVLSGLAGFFISLYLHRPSSPRAEDVQTIQTFHFPALFVKQLQGDPEAGKKIFKEFCSTCHAKNPSIDVNAPRIGDKNAWKFRRQIGEDALLNLTAHGVGAMPARGGCFECSDAQLRETIRYMLGQT